MCDLICYLSCIHVSTGILEHKTLLNTFAISRYISNYFFFFVCVTCPINVYKTYRTSRCTLLCWRFFTMLMLLFSVSYLPSFRWLFSYKNKKFIRSGNQLEFAETIARLFFYTKLPSSVIVCRVQHLPVISINRLREGEDIRRVNVFNFIIVFTTFLW